MKMEINDKEYEIGPDANLGGANLRGANLGGANLRGANLGDANLGGAAYAITQMLFARWDNIPDDLCCQLMRLDAEAIPNGARLMREWVDGGDCPLSQSRYARVANFHERRNAYRPGRPWSLWRIWKALAKEKKIKIDKGEKK